MGQATASEPHAMYYPTTKGTGGDGFSKNIIYSIDSLDAALAKNAFVPPKRRIAPEKLYNLRTASGETIEFSVITRIRAVIEDCLKVLVDALAVADELERESVMCLLVRKAFQLSRFLKVSENFRDAICLLHTAIRAESKSAYTREKIVALKAVLELMKENVYMREPVLDECISILKKNGFDVNAPLAEIGLNI